MRVRLIDHLQFLAESNLYGPVGRIGRCLEQVLWWYIGPLLRQGYHSGSINQSISVFVAHFLADPVDEPAVCVQLIRSDGCEHDQVLHVTPDKSRIHL